LAEKSGPSKTRRLFFMFVTTVVGLVVIGAIGELLMRQRGAIDLAAQTSQKMSPNPMKQWAMIHPFCAFSPRPGKDHELAKSVNNFGFISTPDLPAIKKAEGTVRIAFLGGSSTAGTGMLLADEDTWPFRAWLHLKKKFPSRNVEMINAAVNGYTSFESYARLWSEVALFEPDIVVCYHGWNEMYYFDDCSPERLFRRKWDREADWSFPPVVIPPRLAPKPADRFFSWSRLYSAMRVAGKAPAAAPSAGEIGPPRREESELADSFDPRGPSVFRDNLRLMRQACDVMGAEFYVVKQATLITPDLPDQIRKERCFTWYHAFNYKAHLRAFDAVNRMIDETFLADRVIDATVLSGRQDLLWDHVHPKADGAKAIGKLVADFLAEKSLRFR